jgi:hypothetical protein
MKNYPRIARSIFHQKNNIHLKEKNKILKSGKPPLLDLFLMNKGLIRMMLC